MLYHGTHTSLYKSLPSNIIPVLEDAILKARLRLYKSAEEIFKHELEPYNQLPIVLMEYAELLLHQFRCIEALEVLKAFPRVCSSDEQEDRDIKQYVAIFSGWLLCQTEGIYEPALDEIEKMRREWALKPVDEYTDIQVECIRKYHLACMFLAYTTNFLTDNMKLLPTRKAIDAPSASWQGLKDLRISLVSQDRFMEALRFSSTERTTVSAIERYQTTCELLKLSMDHRAQVSEAKDGIPWYSATLPLIVDLANLFVELGAKTEAETWISLLESHLKETIDLVNAESGSFLNVSDCLETMSVEYLRLKLLENDAPTESRFQQALSLGERMFEAFHISTNQCHYLSIEWAKKLYPDNPAVHLDIQLRTQHLFEDVQGRIPLAATNLTEIVGNNPNLNDAAKNIEMLDNFERKHHHITLPGIKRTLIDLRGILEFSLGRRVVLDSDEHRRLTSQMATGYYVRNETSSIEVNEETHKVKAILDKQAEEDREFNMLYQYFSAPLQTMDLVLLKELLVDEAASGVISQHAIAQLFGLGDPTDTTTSFSIDEILNLDEQSLLQRLVGTKEAPIFKQEWLPRREALMKWLLDESRPNFPLRQCLWVSVHNRRITTLLERHVSGIWTEGFIALYDPEGVRYHWTKTPTKLTKAYARAFAMEIEELVEAKEERIGLAEAKLGYGNQHYERETYIVQTGLPQFYISLFVSSREFRQEHPDYLERADKMARELLVHCRSVKNYQGIATSAINLAAIAQIRIECQIVKNTSEVKQILNEALELLEEVEVLVGNTFYDLDLSHSLNTLQTKVHMGGTLGLWRVGSVATRLLLHGAQVLEKEFKENGSEEKQREYERSVLRLWQWIQRCKARALAQSMGLENVVPDSMLVELQKSISQQMMDTAKEKEVPPEQTSPADEAHLASRLTALTLKATSEIPLELLPEIREYLRVNNIVIPKLVLDIVKQENFPRENRAYILADAISMSRDLLAADQISNKLIGTENRENEDKRAVEELSTLKRRIASKSVLHRLLTIASFLNQEEALLHLIKNGTERDVYQLRVELQRLRKEMHTEPLLDHMLRIREGWPLSNEDLHTIAATRDGKAVFVDWFVATSEFKQFEKTYMLIWRNGICKLINLETDMKVIRQDILDFFAKKELYLPDVDPTEEEDMDIENLLPKRVFKDDPQPVLNCIDLIKPLFNDPLVQKGDLLVLSSTEGLYNYPLHAIEDDENGPLILNHPVVYTPSFSVLHKCFWTRYTSNKNQGPETNVKSLQSLILGGIIDPEPGFQYGLIAVDNIGQLVKASETTFVGENATLDNFNLNISSSDLLHIHLHTNYETNTSPSANEKSGHLSSEGAEDTKFTSSPLEQALIFSSPNHSDSNHPKSKPPKNYLTAQQILHLQPQLGSHLNLIACSSGRAGTFPSTGHNTDPKKTPTNEVMGLVPAFLFAGVGSVTSTLWPIMDEHGAVFSYLLFREFMKVKERIGEAGEGGEGREGEGGRRWIDMADVNRRAVLEMRRIYGQPSAWAGFVLSGFWRFEI